MVIDAMLDRGVLPDWALRAGIRRVCAARLREQQRGGGSAQPARLGQLLDHLADAPIAATPEAANAQHYDVPAEFFALVLGSHRKYSCACWPDGVTRLDDAEAVMLCASSSWPAPRCSATARDRSGACPTTASERVSEMLRHFALALLTLVILDGVWLGFVMGDFYRRQLGSLARLADGRLDPLWPVAALVYPAIALGLAVFVLARARTPLDARRHGALFGALTYAVYDLTNHATLRDWRTTMTLVDIGCGAFSCGLTSWLVATVSARS